MAANWARTVVASSMSATACPVSSIMSRAPLYQLRR